MASWVKIFLYFSIALRIKVPLSSQSFNQFLLSTNGYWCPIINGSYIKNGCERILTISSNYWNDHVRLCQWPGVPMSPVMGSVRRLWKSSTPASISRPGCIGASQTIRGQVYGSYYVYTYVCIYNYIDVYIDIYGIYHNIYIIIYI